MVSLTNAKALRKLDAMYAAVTGQPVDDSGDRAKQWAAAELQRLAAISPAGGSNVMIAPKIGSHITVTYRNTPAGKVMCVLVGPMPK